MTLPDYPASIPGNFLALGYKVKWEPVFFNQSHKTLTGASIDIGLASTPLHNFELTYPFLRYYNTSGGFGTNNTEFQILMGFWLMNGGSIGRFYFVNPDDSTVLAQVIGVSDGSTTSYVIKRTFGSVSPFNYGGTEPVGNSTVSAVYFNTGGGPVLQTLGTNYTLDVSQPANNLVNLITVPPANAIITVDMTYKYYCKFTDDTLTFEKWANQIWSSQSVKIQSCRPKA